MIWWDKLPQWARIWLAISFSLYFIGGVISGIIGLLRLGGW